MNFEIRILVGVSAEHNILPTVSCKKKKKLFLSPQRFFLFILLFFCFKSGYYPHEVCFSLFDQIHSH